MSRLTRTQNRELSLRCITYYMHRVTSLITLMMGSTKPKRKYIISFNYVWRLKTRQVQVFSISKIEAPFMNLFSGNVSVGKGYSLCSRYLIPIPTSFMIIRFMIIRIEGSCKV
jgi:hypothetical protein